MLGNVSLPPPVAATEFFVLGVVKYLIHFTDFLWFGEKTNCDSIAAPLTHLNVREMCWLSFLFRSFTTIFAVRLSTLTFLFSTSCCRREWRVVINVDPAPFQTTSGVLPVVDVARLLY